MVLCETPGIIQINRIFLYMQITFWDISYVYLFCRIGFINRSSFIKLSRKDFRWKKKGGKNGLIWRNLGAVSSASAPGKVLGQIIKQSIYQLLKMK